MRPLYACRRTIRLSVMAITSPLSQSCSAHGNRIGDLAIVDAGPSSALRHQWLKKRPFAVAQVKSRLHRGRVRHVRFGISMSYPGMDRTSKGIASLPSGLIRFPTRQGRSMVWPGATRTAARPLSRAIEAIEVQMAPGWLLRRVARRQQPTIGFAREWIFEIRVSVPISMQSIA